MKLTKDKGETQLKYGFFGTSLIKEGENYLMKNLNMVYYQVFPKQLQILESTIVSIFRLKPKDPGRQKTYTQGFIWGVDSIYDPTKANSSGPVGL